MRADIALTVLFINLKQVIVLAQVFMLRSVVCKHLLRITDVLHVLVGKIDRVNKKKVNESSSI